VISVMPDEKLMIKKLTDNGYLVDPSLLKVNLTNFDDFLNYLKKNYSKTMINKSVYEEFLKKNSSNNVNNQKTVVNSLVNASKEVIVRARTKFPRDSPSKVEVLKDFKLSKGKRKVSDWVDYFNDRYYKIKNILQNRLELKGSISINRIKSLKDKESCSTIGLIQDIRKTRNDNLWIVLEDPTDTINLIITPVKRDLWKLCQDLVFDEVIGVVGVKSGDFLFVNKIIFPDVPLVEEKKAPVEGLAVFIGDLHVGSNMFLPKLFTKFCDWLKGKIGDQKQRLIASKVNYLFILGDLVDGVGVYPSQEEELVINDIYEQYKVLYNYLVGLPENIKLIIIPGNHDSLRLAEPQPSFPKKFCEPLYELPNTFLLSNPSMVRIHGFDGFPGFKVLNYHGYSYTHYMSTVPTLKEVIARVITLI